MGASILHLSLLWKLARHGFLRWQYLWLGGYCTAVHCTDCSPSTVCCHPNAVKEKNQPEKGRIKQKWHIFVFMWRTVPLKRSDLQRCSATSGQTEVPGIMKPEREAREIGEASASCKGLAINQMLWPLPSFVLSGEYSLLDTSGCYTAFEKRWPGPCRVSRCCAQPFLFSGKAAHGQTPRQCLQSCASLTKSQPRCLHLASGNHNQPALLLYLLCISSIHRCSPFLSFLPRCSSSRSCLARSLWCTSPSCTF